MPVINKGRLPTNKELALWRKFERTFDLLTLTYYRARVRQANADAAYRVAKKHRVSVPYKPGADQKLDRVGAFVERTRRAIRGVEDQRYGIRIVDGDIDIIEPRAEGEQFGAFIVPILIATGAVILVGAIAHAIKKHLETEECEEAYKKVTDYADDRFCVEPGPLCNDWTEVKESAQYKRNESFIDGLTKGIGKVGKAAIGGITWGLLIAVPILLYSWFGRRRSQ